MALHLAGEREAQAQAGRAAAEEEARQLQRGLGEARAAAATREAEERRRALEQGVTRDADEEVRGELQSLPDVPAAPAGTVRLAALT